MLTRKRFQVPLEGDAKSLGKAIHDYFLSLEGKGSLAIRNEDLFGLKGFASVHEWGAKGDGVTDDSPAIQRAMDNNPNKILLFDELRYRLVTPLTPTGRMHLRGKRGGTEFVLATQNMNGINFTAGSGNNTSTVEGITFTPALGVGTFASGYCVNVDTGTDIKIRDCIFYARDSGGTPRLKGGVRINVGTNVDVLFCQSYNLIGDMVNADGDDSTHKLIDCRFDYLQAYSCANAVVFGDFSEGCTVNFLSATPSGWGVKITTSLFNFFIEQPDIEAGASGGGVYVADGSNVRIVGGWMGGGTTLKVDSGADGVTWTGGISQNAPGSGIVLSGPVCGLVGVDIVGDNSTTTTGVTVNAGATDANIIGCSIRQWTSEGIKFVGSPARGLVDGVTFRNNAASNITGDNYAAGPLVRNCVTDHSSALTAASALTPKHGHHRVIVTGATAINTITPLGLDSLLVIQAGAGGITLNHSASILLNGSVNATIPANSSITLICTGTAWIELCRNYALAGAGTVTSFAFTNGGGFTGSVTNATTTPTLGLTLDNDAVSYAQIQNVSATDKVLGRSSLGAGDIEEITCTSAARSILDDTTVGAIRTTLGVGTGDSPTLTALTLTNGQLVFPATQVASANANTLDDYEEGTWTPTLAGSTTAGTQTYATQSGIYDKIGRQVTAAWNIGLSAKGGTTAGNMLVKGFPFTSSGTYIRPCTLAYTRKWDLNVAGAFYTVQAFMNPSVTQVEVWEAGDNVVPVNLTDVDVANDTYIYGSVTYDI